HSANMPDLEPNHLLGFTRLCASAYSCQVSSSIAAGRSGTVQMLEPSALKRRLVRPFTRGTVRKALRLANRARTAGDWQTVVSYYTDALGADPGLPMVWN